MKLKPNVMFPAHAGMNRGKRQADCLAPNSKPNLNFPPLQHRLRQRPAIHML